MAPAALLVRLPSRPARASLPNQGFARRAGVSSLAVRAKESDDFSALVSEKPAEPAPAKREAWKGFGREVSNGDDEVQMQGESASWNVLNQIGVEVMEVVGLGFTVWFTSRYLIFKENRDELITRIGFIKKQILGSRGD